MASSVIERRTADGERRVLTWWLLSNGAVLALWMMPWSYGGTGVVRIDISHVFPALMGWATFFVLFVGPILQTPRAAHWRSEHGPGLLRQAGRIVLMAALALPMWLLAQFLSDTPLLDMGAAVGLWFVVATWVECVCAAVRAFERAKAHYLVIASILCGMVPMIHYVRYEILRTRSDWLAVFCPVWGVVRAACGFQGRHVVAMAIFFGGTAVIAAILSSVRRSSSLAILRASQEGQR